VFRHLHTELILASKAGAYPSNILSFYEKELITAIKTVIIKALGANLPPFVKAGLFRECQIALRFKKDLREIYQQNLFTIWLRFFNGIIWPECVRYDILFQQEDDGTNL